MQPHYSIRFPLLHLLLVGALLPCLSTANGQTWYVGVDYSQQEPQKLPASDFDFVFRGDVRNQITGTGSDNGFPDPTDSTTFDGFKTTVRFFSSTGGGIPDDPDPPAPENKHHFGISGIGEKPKIIEKKWTYPAVLGVVAITVPDPNMSVLYFPATHELQVTAENLTADTVTLSGAGYLLSPTAYALADLNSTVLPPSSFLALPALNGEYLPGDARSVMLSGVSLSDYLVTFGTVVFSGASASNFYRGTGSEWAQFAVGANAVPEPSVLAFSIAGVVSGVLVALCRRRVVRR